MTEIKESAARGGSRHSDMCEGVIIKAIILHSHLKTNKARNGNSQTKVKFTLTSTATDFVFQDKQFVETTVFLEDASYVPHQFSLRLVLSGKNVCWSLFC